MGDKVTGKIKEWAVLYGIITIVPILCYSLMIFTGTFNDTDGTWHGSISYAGGWELSEGRWLWPFMDKAKAYLSPDPLQSILSIAIFALGYIILMELLEIKDRRVQIISGLLFMISTPICCSLSYRYMSHVFSLAFLLAVLAAYFSLTVSKTLPMIVATAVCIALSMGLYQADLGTTVLVMVAGIIFKLWRGEEAAKALIRAGKCLLSILVGGILYYLIWQIELIRNEMQASSYGGADSVTVGGIFTHLPGSALHTVSSFISYFGNNTFKINLLPRWVHLTLILIFAVMTIYALVAVFKADRKRAVLLAVLTALIPLCPMCTYMLTYNVSYMSGQMTVPMALCFSLMVCLTWEYASEGIAADKDEEKGEGTEERSGISRFLNKNGVKAVVTVLCVIVIYGQNLMAQYDMYAMESGMRSVKTLAYEVLDELIAEGLYAHGVNYCFVGAPADNPLYVKNDVYEKCNSYAKYGDWGLVANDNRLGWQGFMMNVMGVNMGITSDEDIETMSSDPRVLAMPVFPTKGSVAMVEDKVVIRISE